MNTYVWLRGSLYILLAMLTAFSGWLNDLTQEALPKLSWIEWAGMAVSVLSAGLLSMRSYIDGSAERERVKNGNGKITPA